MKKTMIVVAVCVIGGMLMASSAFCGSSAYRLQCRKKDGGTVYGVVIINQSWLGDLDVKPKDAVHKCNEKYLNECNGQCWLCQNKPGPDVIFNTCWGPNGECVGADCNVWD